MTAKLSIIIPVCQVEDSVRKTLASFFSEKSSFEKY